ncbi:MAG: undecaprenyl-phosphate glucose phosphotransferase [Bradyrhizobium sp.]
MLTGSEVRETNATAVTPYERPRLNFPCEAIPYLLSTADALIILLVSLFGAFFYHWSFSSPLPDLAAYFALGLIASFIHIIRLGGRGYYDFERAAKPGVEITEVLVSWSTTGLILAFFAFVFKIGVSFSRGTFLMLMVGAPIALLGQRKFAKFLVERAISRGVIGRRNTVLVGDENEIASLSPRDLLDFFGAGEINRFVLGRHDDPVLQQSGDAATLNQVANFVRKHNSTEVLLAVPWSDAPRIDFIREQIKILPISARLLPDIQVRTLTNHASSGGQRTVSIEVQRAPLSTAERLLKRAIDLVVALIALVFFIPIMTFSAIAIKLDGRGPIIFRQHRKGFNGHEFVMFKFRTMSVLENGEVVTQASREDPRVTGIGRLLRASSIDELPQLWNVVRGEMSVVGPRPHALAHDNYFEKLLQDYAFRHHVKPGMTGWAQVNGLRGATPSVEQISRRVQMDLWYINNWSLWLDIQILLKTCSEVLRKRNAY